MFDATLFRLAAAAALLAGAMRMGVTLFGASVYAIGSVLLLTGLAGLGALMLRVHGAPRLAPTLWIAAWLCALASLTFAPLAQVGGFLYGLGLFIAGTALGSGLPGGDSKRQLP